MVNQNVTGKVRELIRHNFFTQLYYFGESDLCHLKYFLYCPYAKHKRFPNNF